MLKLQVERVEGGEESDEGGAGDVVGYFGRVESRGGKVEGALVGGGAVDGRGEVLVFEESGDDGWCAVVG